jgi:hypothetical protein
MSNNEATYRDPIYQMYYERAMAEGDGKDFLESFPPENYDGGIDEDGAWVVIIPEAE